MRMQKTRTQATVYLSSHELARYLLTRPAAALRCTLESERLDVSTWERPNEYAEGGAYLKVDSEIATGVTVDGAFNMMQAANARNA